MAGDGLGTRAGVTLERPDGGVPGPGEQHGRAGAVLGLVGQQTKNAGADAESSRASLAALRGPRPGWPAAGSRARTTPRHAGRTAAPGRSRGTGSRRRPRGRACGRSETPGPGGGRPGAGAAAGRYQICQWTQSVEPPLEMTRPRLLGRSRSGTFRLRISSARAAVSYSIRHSACPAAGHPASRSRRLALGSLTRVRWARLTRCYFYTVCALRGGSDGAAVRDVRDVRDGATGRRSSVRPRKRARRKTNVLLHDHRQAPGPGGRRPGTVGKDVAKSAFLQSGRDRLFRSPGGVTVPPRR